MEQEREEAEDVVDLRYSDGTLVQKVPARTLKIDPMYHPQGSLAVPGANEDSARIAQMIQANMEDIDDIIVTRDTHQVRFD